MSVKGRGSKVEGQGGSRMVEEVQGGLRVENGGNRLRFTDLGVRGER